MPEIDPAPRPLTPDSYLGAWLVSEYVYDPDGTFAGIVHQRRQLHRLESGNIRVVQQCSPGPELVAHPMGAFAGEWVFELSVDGRIRRYHGPDVIGTGLTWGEGALTGRGLWPRFGHNFTSFAVLPTPERQITGGKFFNASEMVANIIGLAVPDRDDVSATREQWPSFAGPQWPGKMNEHWYGTLRTVNADGVVQKEISVERRYAGPVMEESDGLKLEFRPIPSPIPTTRLVTGSPPGGGEARLSGIAKYAGWLLELEAVTTPDMTLELMEVLDVPGGNLIGLRKWREDDVLQKVEVLKLRPVTRDA